MNEGMLEGDTNKYMRPNVPYVQQGKSNYDVRGNRAGIRTEYKQQMDHARLTSIYYCKNKKCGVILGMCNTGRNMLLDNIGEHKDIINRKYNLTGVTRDGKIVSRIKYLNLPNYAEETEPRSIETNIKRINNLDVIGTESINCNATDDNLYIKPDDKLCKETNITFEPLDNLSKFGVLFY